jgi:SAM-dependent methyltransferase
VLRRRKPRGGLSPRGRLAITKSMKPAPRPAVALLLALVGALGLCPAAQAQLGARSAAEWVRMLDARARVSKLRVDDVVAALALRPGAKVADIGAGSGVFTLPLASAVTSSGRVYAVDIEQGLVDHIAGKARDAKVSQVQGVLGKFTDPALPARDLDLAFIYDVLHHIEDRATYLRNLAGYLQPGGRVAVIDFFPERGPHRNDPSLQITKEQTRRLMSEAGLRLLAEHRLYDDKWFVIYGQ